MNIERPGVRETDDYIPPLRAMHGRDVLSLRLLDGARAGQSC